MTRFSRAVSTTASESSLRVVDRDYALHLRQQPPEQAEVPAGDASDGPYDLWRRRPRKGAHAQSGPVLLQQVLHFHRSQRPELTDKADARVELRVSRDALFKLSEPVLPRRTQ